MDNSKIIKMVENGLVIIVLFVILIYLTKPIEKLVESSRLQSVKESTRGVIKETRNYFTSLTLFDTVDYPFKIVFDEKEESGYKLYAMGGEYTPVEDVKFRVTGKMPTSGSIELISDSETVVSNLKFGKFICNKADINAQEVCVLDSNEK
ncbi:MAG: hypothetical protein IKF91_03675 [Bacilli bacterium]|nr:hypothetical protein [Bacilli bacterium]